MNSPSYVDQRIAVFRKSINEQLQTVLTKQQPLSLYEPMRYTLNAGGKRLRPLLVLLSCEAVGGDHRQALSAAVAVELLHNFTLIHDDVMDQDDTRRGQPTVHRKWDTDVAILSGDGLVALSYEVLLRTQHPHIERLGHLFSHALLEVCEGQAMDKDFEARQDVDLSEYFLMIRKKTAALIALCCELGGDIAAADKNTVRTLKEFGENLGIAFQIQDDLLDIVADEKHLGKTWGSDIKRKKKTMLLIQAKKIAGSQEKFEIDRIMQKNLITNEDIKQMKNIFDKTGTLVKTQHLLNKHFEIAGELLKSIKTDEEKKLLGAFLESIIHRTY